MFDSQSLASDLCPSSSKIDVICLESVGKGKTVVQCFHGFHIYTSSVKPLKYEKTTTFLQNIVAGSKSGAFLLIA